MRHETGHFGNFKEVWNFQIIKFVMEGKEKTIYGNQIIGSTKSSLDFQQ